MANITIIKKHKQIENGKRCKFKKKDDGRKKSEYVFFAGSCV